MNICRGKFGGGGKTTYTIVVSMFFSIIPYNPQKGCLSVKLIGRLRGCHASYSSGGFPKLGVPTIMENSMEKKMEHEMETGIILGIIGIRVSQN